MDEQENEMPPSAPKNAVDFMWSSEKYICIKNDSMVEKADHLAVITDITSETAFYDDNGIIIETQCFPYLAVAVFVNKSGRLRPRVFACGSSVISCMKCIRDMNREFGNRFHVRMDDIADFVYNEIEIPFLGNGGESSQL